MGGASSAHETSPPPLRSSPDRTIKIAGAVAVATVVVFSVLAAGLVPGVGPFPSGGSLAPDTTAAGAVLMAQGIAAGAPGGPWSLAAVSGWAFTTQAFFDENPFCIGNLTPVGGTLQNASMGPYSGDYRTGIAVLWFLTYSSPVAGGGNLVVQVDNGVAQEVGVVPQGCYGSAAVFSPLGPVIDSSVAVEAALLTPNGTRYSSMFQEANATYDLDSTGYGPVWWVFLSACPNEDRVAPGQFGELSASVWAANGTVDQPPQIPVSC